MRSSLSARSKVSVASIGGTGRLPPHLLATPATGQTFSRRRSMCSLALDDTRPKPLRETRARGWRMSMAPVAEGILATLFLESAPASEGLGHFAPFSPSGIASTTLWKSCQAASVLAGSAAKTYHSSLTSLCLGLSAFLFVGSSSCWQPRRSASARRDHAVWATRMQNSQERGSLMGLA